jgi:hypothetical protein
MKCGKRDWRIGEEGVVARGKGAIDAVPADLFARPRRNLGSGEFDSLVFARQTVRPGPRVRAFTPLGRSQLLGAPSQIHPLMMSRSAAERDVPAFGI